MTTVQGTGRGLLYASEVLASDSSHGLNTLSLASQIHPGIAVILIIIIMYY
jgi:hypothetical protein